MDKTVTVGFSCPEVLAERIKEEAKTRDLSASQLIRRAVEDYIGPLRLDWKRWADAGYIVEFSELDCSTTIRLPTMADIERAERVYARINKEGK